MPCSRLLQTTAKRFDELYRGCPGDLEANWRLASPSPTFCGSSKILLFFKVRLSSVAFGFSTKFFDWEMFMEMLRTQC